ncbi:MAG: acyl--CoA ligase [Gammaproteobacteria bacterium]|nr:acyl--CoA ligase [Gammaproteobacteria bacterium]
MPIYESLNTHRRYIPDSVAATNGPETLTYSDLAGRVDTLTKSMIASGIAKGDRVVTLAAPSIEFWISFLATVSIGAIWSGLNPRYRQHECRTRLEELQPKLVLVLEDDIDGRDHFEEIQHILNNGANSDSTEIFSFGERNDEFSFDCYLSRGEKVSKEEYRTALSAVRDEDIAAIVYTSGSTGDPKGAMLSHGAMLRCAAASVEWLGDSLQKAIMSVPINHVGGLNNLCMNVFCHGGTIRFLGKFSIEDILEIGDQESVTYVGHNQTTFTMLLGLPDFSLEKMHACKALVHGGSRTSEKTLARFSSLDSSISSVYAQTESCGYILHSQHDATLDVMANTLGKPMGGVKIRISHPTSNKELPIGEVGEMQAKFDWAFSGYYNDSKASDAAFTDDGYLKTGDLCLVRSDGNIELIERMSQMYKSGGHSIFPTEIEQAICRHPDVAMAAVLGVKNELFGEVGYAFVMPIQGTALIEQDVDEFLRQQIANFKVPKTIRLLKSMPLLPNTKIDKQALKDLLNDNP